MPVTPYFLRPMREELGSAAAVTVVLVLYASTVAMPAAPQVQAAGSDDWARGIVVGHQSAPAAEPAETGRAASSEWDPVLNAHVSREAVWPSEQPSFGRFLTPALLTKESELCSGDCDGMYNFSVEFGYPLDGVNRVRND